MRAPVAILLLLLGAASLDATLEECQCLERNTGGDSCSCSEPLGRYSIEPSIAIYNLYNKSGTIVAPPDPNGNFHYCNYCETLWILDMGESDIKIELTIENTDLGFLTNAINNNDLMNSTDGDFLLIGTGSDIMSGNELLFYGRRKQAQKVVIPGGVAHVFFYSTESVFDATGFNITYNSTKQVTTQAPITYQRFLKSRKLLWLLMWPNYNDTFKKNIAAMATDYLHSMFVINKDIAVTPEMVFINDMKTCHPFNCDVNCVAYNFSMDVFVNDNPVFTSRMLNQMLSDPELQFYITNITGTSEICNEHPKISTPVYIAVPLTLVVLSIILTFAVCWYSKKSVFNESHIKYEKEQQERIEDARCRYSDTASILGLGLGEPSGGSVSSMPFSKPTRDDDDFEYKTEDFDMTEFREYDPDNVGLYMADIQLENVLGTQQPMRSYTNKAFVPDEEDTFYQKKSTFHNISDSESDDSDDGGVINLQESTRDQRQTHFLVPAEVHVGDDSGETVL
nr:uncharacterized protein LOC128696579 [Cherax quadricarinatus]